MAHDIVSLSKCVFFFLIFKSDRFSDNNICQLTCRLHFNFDSVNNVIHYAKEYMPEQHFRILGFYIKNNSSVKQIYIDLFPFY